MPKFYLGTETGFLLVKSRDVSSFKEGTSVASTSLEKMNVRRIAINPDDVGEVYAGTYGNGLFKSEDGGKEWFRVGADVLDDHIRSILLNPTDPKEVYVGTEPANLYRSRDGGATWTDLKIRELPGSEGWYLPYSPRAGAVRTLAIHEMEPEVVYGGVEDGGLIKSEDGGRTWFIDHEGIHHDVHGLSMHPEDPERILAATGGGFYVTEDGGEGWDRIMEDYTRDVAFSLGDPESAFAGPATGIGKGGRIVVSRDAGKSWEGASDGLDVPMDDMVELFVQDERLPDVVFAVTSGGRVLYSEVDEASWEEGFRLDRHVKDLALA